MSAASNSTADVNQLVGHLFRRESGRLVAILTRHFGIAHLPLAEDVVQDALVRAMQTWPHTGVPQNPSAWLLQAAKNRALDHARRDSVWRGKQVALVPLMEDCLQSSLTEPAPQFEDEIHDSQLRMMFVCCHPGLPVEAQVALILKTLCGFGEKEIAAAFLASEASVAKRLVRARSYLREQEVAVELPPAPALAPRVEAIQQALYLLFNEGYKASHGDSLLREDLCAEAIRLGTLLAAHPAGDRPATHALLALMFFNVSRLPARTNDAGDLLLLADQDRRLWRREDIQHGIGHLGASSAGDRVTRYHLEAGIAACHALAPNFAATNWTQIIELYDQLLALDGSPVVALSRAVAIAQAKGAAAGLVALE
ncbi:MAG TPA: sigma-70 family RNA polymerase sigma factor, partial [Candidatus Didemnitutus sp.]|nr:sigma-70 family RNA polymerase sigma factor [Candidatus Didemnitutus sp.]